MSTADSRKVLEEIQKAKNTLLKQQSGPIHNISGPLPSPLSHSSTPILSNHFPNTNVNDAHVSPIQRLAYQTLQQANSNSFGSFIATDSHFGNGILPVLPRLTENISTK